MINYSTTPANNNKLVNTSLFQNWAPVLSDSLPFYYTNYYYYPQIALVSPTSNIVFKIKDVLNDPAYAQYSAFRLRGHVYYDPGNPLSWCLLQTYNNQGYPRNDTTIPITSEMQFNFDPILAQYSLLPIGIYTLNHSFRIEALNPNNNQWVMISAYIHYLKFHISNDLATYSPNVINFQAVANTPYPVNTINIDGNNWKIIGNVYFILSSATPGVTITTATQTINGYTSTYQTISGFGVAAIDITLSTFYDTATLLSGLSAQGSLEVQAGNAFLGTINYTTSLLNAGTLTSSPLVLDFFAIKNIEEADAQYIRYSCTEAYTITSSVWLTVEDTIIVYQNHTTSALLVKPISTQSMSPGQYTGFVTISAVIDGIPSSRTTIINYTIDDFVSSPYELDKKAFTLDNKFFTFSSTNTENYFQVDALVKVYSFYNSVEREHIIPQKIVLFQGTSQLNFGKIIHQIMDNFPEINDDIFQYKPALLQLKCQEKKLIDNDIVKEIQLEDIQFVAGLSKKAIVKGILDFNILSNRVTTKSYAYINLLVPSGSFYLEILRNNVFYQAMQLPPSNDGILCKKITFNTFNQGDIISVQLSENNKPGSVESRPYPKKFIVFPTEKHSNHIVWEDEYLLKKAIECTGSPKILSEFEFQTNKKYKSLVEQLNILQTDKSVKFTINTGWLLKSDVDTIESLMKTKRAFLDASKMIAIVPIGKSMINEDTDRELIEFTLEFQINPTYNEETYSH